MSRRVLVTGSRDWVDTGTIINALDEHLRTGDVLVHGACPGGADRIAEWWWTELGEGVERWRADWDAHGRSAGPRRNQAMVDSRPGLVLAFIRNNSRGAEGCLRAAQLAGIPAVIYRREDR